MAPGQMRFISSFFGDEFAGRLGQHLDDLEGTSAHWHGRSENPQFAASEVDLALARRIDRPHALSRHTGGPRRDLSSIPPLLCASRGPARILGCDDHGSVNIKRQALAMIERESALRTF